MTASRSIKCLSLLLVMLLSACSDSKNEYHNLSQKPPLSVVPHSIPKLESVIQTRLRIPLHYLEEKLETDIPETLYDDAGEVKQKCIRIFGKNLCETYQVGGWADRTGPVQLTPLSNGFLRIAIPLTYKLKVTGNGRVVKELLRNVDFKTASFTAITDLRPYVSNDWQLQLAVNSTIQWAKKPQVNVLGIDFNIQEKVEQPIKKALAKALAKLQHKVSSDNRFKSLVENFWQTIQKPRQLKGPFPLWLQTNPHALSLSAIQFEQDAIQMSLSLQTYFSASSSDQNLSKQATSLPPLTEQVIGNPTVRINLPLALDYQDLASSLDTRLKNEPLKLQQGKTSITVKSIEVYPNNDRLVLAAKVKLSGLAGFLDSDGEIYISGKPVIDNQNKTLKLTDAAFSRKLDSVFWSAASKLMHNKLLSGLQESLVYDFSENYEALHQSINQQLQGAYGKKLRLNGRLSGLSINGVQLGLDSLQLNLEAQGQIGIESTSL